MAERSLVPPPLEIEAPLAEIEGILASPASPASPPPKSAEPSRKGKVCWGRELKKIAEALNDCPCEPDFVPGKQHLKNKFCARCREEGINIPVEHMGTLAPQFERQVRQRRSALAPCTS